MWKEIHIWRYILFWFCSCTVRAHLFVFFCSRFCGNIIAQVSTMKNICYICEWSPSPRANLNIGAILTKTERQGRQLWSYCFMQVMYEEEKKTLGRPDFWMPFMVIKDPNLSFFLIQNLWECFLRRESWILSFRAFQPYESLKPNARALHSSETTPLSSSHQLYRGEKSQQKVHGLR